MTKLISICILCCLASYLRAGQFLVHEDFESASSTHIKKLKGVSFSTIKPFNGASHLVAQSHQFEMNILLAHHDLNTRGYLLSCFIDPKGKLNELSVSVANNTYTAQIDPSVVGYRQVVIYIPNHAEVIAEFVLKTQSDNCTFLMDDLKISDCNGTLPVRPQPTQMLSNYKANDKDVFKVIGVNGHDLMGVHSFVADGYVFLSNDATELQQGQNLVLNLELENTKTTYQYGVWVDSNRDGQFSDDEQQLILNASGDVDVTIPFDNQEVGDYAVRVRILNYRATAKMNPYSGDTWGQTIDFMLRVVNVDADKICQCSSAYFFLDMGGKELQSLEDAPPGIYFKVCDSCVEKIVHLNSQVRTEN
jgi:hypothetical protein